jgi:hypothetical protein
MIPINIAPPRTVSEGFRRELGISAEFRRLFNKRCLTKTGQTKNECDERLTQQ